VPDLPNSDFIENDNSKAQALLAGLGLLGTLESQTRLPGDTFSAYAYKRHFTHWIFVINHFGFSNPADNGLIVQGLLKSQCSESAFLNSVQKFMNDGIYHRVDFHNLRDN
jgi:hypothetical protein